MNQSSLPGDPGSPGAHPFSPLAPLNLVDPDIAFQLMVYVYVMVGTTSVVLWDVLDNLTSDYLLVTRFPVKFPTIAYFISRGAVLTYFFLSVVLLASPNNNCATINTVSGWFFAAALGSTDFLFFLRVRAIYNRNIYVTALFFTLWICDVVGAATVPFGNTGTNIGPTKYCIQVDPKWFLLVAPAIGTFVNDTLVYFALTWRLLRTAPTDPKSRFTDRLKTAFSGSNLPALSKALLRDGQSYYLLSVTIRCLVFVTFHINAIPEAYRSMVGVPSLGLIHIAACRVFRNTRFGIFAETIAPPSSSTDNPLPAIPLSSMHPQWYLRTDPETTTKSSTTKLPLPIAFSSPVFPNSTTPAPRSTVMVNREVVRMYDHAGDYNGEESMRKRELHEV